jgi:hypothetical protein
VSKLDVAVVVTPFNIRLGVAQQGSAVLLISVADSNGMPVTGLAQNNFSVKMLYETTPISAQFYNFIDCQTNSPADSLPGEYVLAVTPPGGFWNRVPYSFIIAVNRGKNRGQTVAVLDLSALPTSDLQVQ